MNRVEAFVRRERAKRVKVALDRMGISTFFTTRARMEGRDVRLDDPGSRGRVDMIKIEFATSATKLDIARVSIARAAATADGQDGEVWVSTLIRDGAIGSVARARFVYQGESFSNGHSPYRDRRPRRRQRR